MKAPLLHRPLALAVAACLCALPAPAQTATSRAGTPAKVDFAKARQFLRAHMAEASIPAISVAVAQRGEILWEEGFGLADREQRIPATEHTLYYTASVQKAFTAAALWILQARRQLDLDRPVNDYLGAARLRSPAFDPAGATVRRVANHTAGLTTFHPRHPLPIDEAIRRHGILFWPPGERFDYSNLGYRILEEVVARASGRSHAEFLRTEIFVPLGMDHSTVGIGPGLERLAAQRYSAAGEVRPRVDQGVYCSAHDLAAFGMSCLKARLPGRKAILSDAALDALYDTSVSTGSGRHSLGWSLQDDLHGYRGILAQGGTESDQAWLQLIPSEGLVVAVLANHGGMSSRVVHEVLADALPAYRARLIQAEARDQSRPAPPASRPLPPAGLVGTWKGFVQTPREKIPLTLAIAGSGEVRAQLGAQAATHLEDSAFEQSRVRGRMAGDLGMAEDTGPEPCHLELELCLRGEALLGAAVTGPHARLPFWTELVKAE